MERQARCASCGQLFVVTSTTGALPSVCEPCDPRMAARREANRIHSRNRHVRARELRARIAELEELLDDLRTVPNADRAALALAVRRVGAATGAADTAAALFHLRDVAHSWALALAVRHETTPPSDDVIAAA